MIIPAKLSASFTSSFKLFFRQFLDFGGLYDRDKLFWKVIEDVVLACACAPPGGGRNVLTPRFVRHFGMLVIPAPTEGSLKAIFRYSAHLTMYNDSGFLSAKFVRDLKLSLKVSRVCQEYAPLSYTYSIR